MRSHRFLFLFVCLAVLFPAVASAQATVWVDGTGGSDLTGDGSQGNPYQTIQFSYDSAAGGDTVRVLPGTYNECVVLAGLVSDKPIQVVADDWIASANNTTTIISGDGFCSTVIIGSSDSTLQGFTVRDAGFTGIFAFGSVAVTNNLVTENTSTFGGGIYVYSATCYYGDTSSTVSSNVVTNNHAEFSGSCVGSGTLCVVDNDCGVGGQCTLQGGDGGGVYVFAVGVDAGGALGCLAGDADVTVNNNLIDNNDADNAFGGGLVVFTNTAAARQAAVTVTQNTISNNFHLPFSAGYGGGAWLTTYGYGTENIDFNNNVVADNTSTGDGGGTSAWVNTLGQADHTISLDNNNFTGNVADGNGGGLDMFVFADSLNAGQTIDLSATDNIVSGNTSNGLSGVGGGGGILGTFLSQKSSSPTMNFEISSNTVLSNNAGVSGGGIALVCSADADPALDGNTSPAVANIEVENNLIVTNNATGGGTAVGGGVFSYTEAYGDGTSTVQLGLNTIADNTADVGAGGIEIESFTDFDSLVVDEGLAVLEIDSSIISSNVGFGIGGPLPGQPGVVAFAGSTANFTLDGDYNDVVSNSAGDYESWVIPGPNDLTVDAMLDANYLPANCSPTIDAGDPLLAVGSEPNPNGGRANMGHTGGTVSATESLPDVNGDMLVDGLEILRVSVAFGTTNLDPRYDMTVDLDGNNLVDGIDLALFAAEFANSCP